MGGTVGMIDGDPGLPKQATRVGPGAVLQGLERGALPHAVAAEHGDQAIARTLIERLVDLLGAKPIAEVDSEPFYIYNFPGSMEIASLFRPNIEIEDGLVKMIDMPSSTFYGHEPADLVLFVGKEPNLRWRTFGECIFRLAGEVGVSGGSRSTMS